MSIFQMSLVGLAGVILALFLKNNRQEISFLVVVGVSILIFTSVIDKLQGILIGFNEVFAYLGEFDTYLKVLLKVVGITYLCEFCVSLCKDAGYGAIANQIEIGGKITVLLSGMPIILALIEAIRGLGG